VAGIGTLWKFTVQPPPTRPRQRGATLIESFIVLALLAVIVGAAVPSFQSAQDRRRLEGAAAQLRTELHFARSLAVERNEAVRFSFRAEGTASCYVIHTGSRGACRCEGPRPICQAGAQALRTVGLEAASRLRETSNASSFAFDPHKGTVTPTATLRLSNPRGDVVHLVINIMGRVRSCSPTGLPGYKAC
jgi:type IV fimbrial biogenesis protein FimT